MSGLVDYPILRDDGVYRGTCSVLIGGAIKPMPPVFNPVIVNETDLILRDEDLTIVTENNDELVVVDNV